MGNNTIDIKDDKYLITGVMMMVVTFMIINDYKIIIGKEDDIITDGLETITNIMSLLWPYTISVISILIFNYIDPQKNSYISYLLVLFIIVFLTAYTIYQSNEGGLIRDKINNSEDSDDSNKKKVTEYDSCWGLLPYSNQYDTKDYTIYRIYYLLTLITIAFCVSFSNNSYLKTITTFSPLLLPFLTEFTNTITDGVYPGTGFARGNNNDELRATLSPELLLIHFLRGDRLGDDNDDKDKLPEFIESNWLGETKKDDKLINQYINFHFIISSLFIFFLLFIVIIYSRGIFGAFKTEIPIYMSIIFMIFFSPIMSSIFVQKCSVNNVSQSLQDNYYMYNENKKEKEWGDQPDNETLKKRYKEKHSSFKSILCKIEKYGGFQFLICMCLSIYIINNISNPEDKILAITIIILGSYGLSQSFIKINAFE
tara:strand:+ start:103 stop:1380 length:1278 start_codon:yes stop_codon:yes gene_type:complete